MNATTCIMYSGGAGAQQGYDDARECNNPAVSYPGRADPPSPPLPSDSEVGVM